MVQPSLVQYSRRLLSVTYTMVSCRRRVVVVGAGVIGLSTAVHLSERFGDSLEVTVVAEKFSPNTTADQAGTILLPIDWNAGDVASASQKEKNMRIERWAETTFHR